MLSNRHDKILIFTIVFKLFPNSDILFPNDFLIVLFESGELVLGIKERHMCFRMGFLV